MGSMRGVHVISTAVALTSVIVSRSIGSSRSVGGKIMHHITIR